MSADDHDVVKVPKRYLYLTVSVVLVLTGTAVTLFWQGNASPAAARDLLGPLGQPSESGNPPPRPITNPQVSNDPGAPAIQPTSLTVDPSVPAFSTKDVINYMSITKSDFIGVRRPISPVVVESVEFLTTSQVAARLNSDPLTIGRSAGALLCLTKLQGVFEVGSPLGHVAVFHEAYIVLDAKTGNLVEVSGVPGTKPDPQLSR